MIAQKSFTFAAVSEKKFDFDAYRHTK